MRIVIFETAEPVELTRWVLGCGQNVEVLQPASLRREIARNAKAMLSLYEAK